MEYSLLIFDSDERILPKKSTVSVEQSDGQELLLHKLGYCPTQYSLYLIPNSSLWAGITQSTLTALSTSNHIAHKNIGTLLFEPGRHFSLVLAAKSEERDNDVITKGEEYSTPKCDTMLRDVGESGYSTYHSSIATPAKDVIMTSSPQSKPIECAKLNESCSTIIVSESEDEIEDPLAFRTPTLPGLYSHRLRSQSVDKKSSFRSTSPYFLPPHPKHPSSVKTGISDPNSSYNQQQQGSTSTRDEVIVISSSDEAELPSITTFGGHRSSVQQVPGRSPQSSDEGIVLDSRWEGSRCCNRVENQSMLARAALTDGDQSLFVGEGQVLNQQKASDHTVMVKCGGYELRQADLRTLEPHQWLNDQIINCYMQLLVATYGHRHKVHIMNTFFYTKLSRSGFPGVERWLRRVDMRRLRLLLIPIHVSMCHWALAAVNFRARIITYFDSLGIRNTSCLKRLKVFMRRCVRARRYPCLVRWRLHYAKDIPRQQNGSDCGVFVCQFAKWLCSRSKSRSYSRIPFQQRDMPGFRETMLGELKNGTLHPSSR